MLLHLLLLFSLVFTSGSKLQTPKSKPDFTGTWNARVVPHPDAPVELLKISYNDPELRISRIWIEPTPVKVMGQSLNNTAGQVFVYYTDGRGETQKSDIPRLTGNPETSKTHREGEKFVTTDSWISKQSGKKITTDRTVTLEVSANGERLTKTMAYVSEGNTDRIVYLYDRVNGANTKDINGEWKQRNSSRLISLIVEHHDPEIRVTRRVVTEAQDDTEVSVYYTDGRGEINIKNGHPMKSVTKWKGQRLSFSSSGSSSSGGMTVNSEESIKWEIANSGQSLIEVTEQDMSSNMGFFIPSGPAKLIYARSSSRLPE